MGRCAIDDEPAGDTYNTFSGNATFVVQARTIIGGVHVHVDQERPPISTAAMVSWLVVAAIPLTAGVILGRSGAGHLHDLSGVVALGAAALIGLVAVRIATVVWEWWLLSREQQADIRERRLDQAVRKLVRKFREQWQGEEALRRLQDEYPLPVSWGDAEDGRTLAGSFEQINDIFDRAPSRRLVVLGPAGSGKSVLAVRFALNCLPPKEESQTTPRRIPVILPLASWDPEESLVRWASARLAAEHPELGRRMLSGGTLAEQLWRDGRFLPVLDGFDEIAEPRRAAALRRLNQAFGAKDAVFLTSRPGEYATAIKDAKVDFSRAAVVSLRPLDAHTVREYLRTTTNRTVSSGGREVTLWQPVLDAGSEAVASALTTPLMVALARLAYNETDEEPAELLDPDRFATRDDVERHLLDRLVPAAYWSVEDDDDVVEWRTKIARRRLVFLARRMTTARTQELAWWRLGGRPTRYVAAGLLALLVIGLDVVQAKLGYGPDPDAKTGPLWFVYLVFAVVPVFESAVRPLATQAPVPIAFTSWRGRVRRLVLSLLACAVVAVPLWALLHVGAIFLVCAASIVLVIMVPRGPVDLSTVADQRRSLWSDRRATVALGLWYAVTDARRWRSAPVLLAPLLLFWLWSGNGGAGTDPSAQWSAVAVATGLALFGYGLVGSAWGQFQLTRFELAVRGELPWRVMDFLADAHRRGVLRQTGGVYQFRHARLQDRLAGSPPPVDEAPARRRRFSIPPLLSVLVLLIGAISLGSMAGSAPGAPGPYLGFGPVCAEFQQETAPFLSADPDEDPYYSDGNFDCRFAGPRDDPSLDVHAQLITPANGVSAINSARSEFAGAVRGETTTPATPATCDEPVRHDEPGHIEALCGNAEFTVVYAEAGVSVARKNGVALSMMRVLIGVALGDAAPTPDNATARRAIVTALADTPRPLAPDSGSSRLRSGPEQVVTGAVWGPGDQTAQQDVGEFVFRTPNGMWCDPRTEVTYGAGGGPAPLWYCTMSGNGPMDRDYLDLSLAVWPCPGTCTPNDRTQVEDDWENFVQYRYADFSGVSWQLSDQHTAYADSIVESHQLLMIYLAHRPDGTVAMVAVTLRSDSSQQPAEQKTLNDIRTQAGLSLAPN